MDSSAIKYSRQSAVYGGAGSVQQLKDSRILIFGLGPVGVETVKDLLLAGIGHIYVVDDSLVEDSDADGAFCYDRSHLGLSRTECYIPLLQELSPSAQLVSIARTGVSKEFISKHKVVIVTDDVIGSESSVKMSDTCHRVGVPFVCASIAGLHLSFFQDLGCFRYDVGRPKVRKVIGKAHRDGPDVTVTLIDSSFGVSDRDPLFISLIKDNKPQGPFSFVEERKKKKKPAELVGAHIYNGSVFGECSNTDLDTNLAVPNFVSPQLRMKHKLANVRPWVASLALGLYFRKKNESPRLHHIEDAEFFLEYAKVVWKDKTGRIWTESEEQYFRRISLQCRVISAPAATIMGAVITQEVTKIILHLFKPIDQWFCVDFLEILPSDWERRQFSTVGPGALLGLEVAKKLGEMNLFMVGAGALGCEFIKCFDMMGLCQRSSGILHVTDPDEISESNLHRQFLFREEDMNESKSKTAVERIQKYGGEIDARNYSVQVSDSSWNTFDDNFWKNCDAVVVAVDSAKARTFLNEQCHYYDIVMLESGTLGMQCNTTVICPGKTEPFVTLEDPNTEANCTGKRFPFRPSHTVQWALEIFDKLFHENVKMYRLSTEGVTGIKIASEYHKLVEDCSARKQWIMNIFDQYYVRKIHEITKDHPFNQVEENGESYWSGVRIYPHIENVDVSGALFNNLFQSVNELLDAIFTTDGKIEPQVFEKDDIRHINFVLTASNLYAQIYGLPLQTAEQIHLLAGRVLSAVLSTTAIAVGLTCFEIYKVVQGMNVHQFYNYNGSENFLGFGPVRPVQKHSPSFENATITVNADAHQKWSLIRENLQKEKEISVECLSIHFRGREENITEDERTISETVLKKGEKLSGEVSIKMKMEYIDTDGDYYDLLVRLLVDF